MLSKKLYFLCVFVGLLALCSSASEQEAAADKMEEEEPVDEAKLEYAKGSMCGYCEYCKFCKLCDEQCPCETSASKPNCNMCKYCKFCYLCKGLCNTICQPGGIIDKVSAALVNALPSYNKEEIDSDIQGAQTWIDKKRDEL